MLTQDEFARLNDQQKAFYEGASDKDKAKFAKAMRDVWTATRERSILVGLGATAMVLGGAYSLIASVEMLGSLEEFAPLGAAISTPYLRFAMTVFWVGLGLFATGVLENRLIDINTTLSRRMRPAR